MIYILVNKHGTIVRVAKDKSYPYIESGDIFVELHRDVIEQILMLALKEE